MPDNRREDATLSSLDGDRDLAACLPFLLDAGLSDLRWPDQPGWNLRRAPDLGGGFAPGELYDLSWQMRRILVTPDSGYLDDADFPTATCAGVIVVGPAWRGALDRLLVLVVGLLGPFARLYQGVKVTALDPPALTVTAPARRGQRAIRHFQLDPGLVPPRPIPTAAVHRRPAHATGARVPGR